ncbi:hypothetical protein BX616_005027 [Lobosporangium transversale]|nr:hypothetical protein BX616_005027 [Lobosporangium transversale]
MDPIADDSRSRSSSPESDATTISCPNSPNNRPHRPALDDSEVTEELTLILEELQNVLEYIDQGMILQSFNTLSRLTDMAVTNCEKLVSDKGPMNQKTRFWTALNNCWLFAFSHYNNARSEDQCLREPHLHYLYDNVKAWADTLEKYGLVNYELGLWEQDILEAIECCLINTFAVTPTP